MPHRPSPGVPGRAPDPPAPGRGLGQPGATPPDNSRQLTLGKLAKQYGTTVAAIEKLNPGVSAKNLRVGKKIRVK